MQGILVLTALFILPFGYANRANAEAMMAPDDISITAQADPNGMVPAPEVTQMDHAENHAVDSDIKKDEMSYDHTMEAVQPPPPEIPSDTRHYKERFKVPHHSKKIAKNKSHHGATRSIASSKKSTKKKKSKSKSESRHASAKSKHKKKIAASKKKSHHHVT